MSAPTWLPYRVQQQWNNRLVHRAVRRVHQTAPLPASPPERALADLHLLLCARDVEIGVLALKSLLRFRDLEWAVTLTDDGSLTANHRRWIDFHIPGCQWLPRVSTDPRIEDALRNRPRLASSYRSQYPLMRKLLHPAVLARRKEVIVLDPDTAFWRIPEKIVTWARSASSPALFMHDDQDEGVQVPEVVREGFDELRRAAAPQGAPWSMPYFFFNSGLLCYRSTTCDLDLAERYLTWLETAPAKYTTGKPALWFGTWTQEQTAYQLIFACMEPAAQPLGPSYRIGRVPGATFNHYLWLQLVMSSSLKALRDLTATLPSR